jgi:4Fe-4S binding domain
MNVWLGGQFYRWVRHYETAGMSAYVSRPAGVEGWLPIAGMMNLKYFLVTRQVPELHPAAMFLLVTFVAMAFLFRKAFCSWLCPVGTVSEYLWKLGRKFVSAKFSFAGVGGYTAARVEVLAPGILLVGGFEHVGLGNCRIYAEPVRRGRGCKDAEFFPVHRDHRADGAGGAGCGFSAGAELLVPVFVSVWGAAGVGVGVQSIADSAECRDVH